MMNGPICMRARIFKSVLIIADDFTGACDSVAKFANLGFSSIVTLDIDSTPRLLEEYDAVALDTESRALSANEAFKILLSIGKKIEGVVKEVLIYKKVDSTLRGNIVAEIAGLVDALTPDLIVFAPAFPKQGRTTINGVHLVEGVPVKQTYFGKDIRTPVKSSKIASYFDPTFGNYRHLSLDELRSREFEKKIHGANTLSFDVQNDEDLRTLVRKVMSVASNKDIVWAGSAGLAEHLACQAIIGSCLGKPVLLVVGSANDLAREQSRAFSEAFDARLILVKLRDLVQDYRREHARVLKEVSRALNSSSDMVITTSHDSLQLRNGKRLASELGVSMNEFGSVLTYKLGELTSSIITDLGWGKFAGIVLTGGDVAVSVMKHSRINAVEIEGEIEEGIPILKYKGRSIVTKAGGFGNMYTLIKIAARLKKM